MPVFDVGYPFGLRDTPVSDADIPDLLSRPLTVMLGEADDDPMHHNLPRQPQAVAQGPNRFARGQRYIQTARQIALERNLPLAWKLITVPGVAHSNPGMAPTAAALCAAVIGAGDYLP